MLNVNIEGLWRLYTTGDLGFLVFVDEVCTQTREIVKAVHGG